MAKSIEEAPPNLGESEGESGTPDLSSSLPSGASPEEAFSTEINHLAGSAKAYLDQIGRKVTEKTHADKLANYAVAAAAIASRAEAARVAEKRPVLEASRSIDARWGKVVASAEAVAKDLKLLLVPYLNEQKRKAAEEAAEAARARQAARVAGETPPLARATPSPTTAGTQGRVSLKGQKVYRITDLRGAAEFIAKMNNPPQDFIDGVLSSARTLMKAGVEVPGVEMNIEDTVA